MGDSLERWIAPVMKIARRFSLGSAGDADELEIDSNNSVRAPSFPGDNPVFIYQHRFVIKFFAADSFCTQGNKSFHTESFLYSCVFPQDDIGGTELPVPRFVAMSSLKDLSETDVEEERLDLRSLGTEDWWWPFLVTTRIEGQPLKSIAGQLTPHNRIQMAHNLGKAVRALFDTPLPDDLPSDLSNLRKEYFPSFLDERMRECVRDHERWKTLPPRLIAEIQAYLPSSSAELLSERVEAEFGLIHADIHSEHARISLYRDEGGDQQLKFEGLIDFGDAILGTKLYEMVQVHLSNFLCDKDMLREFFEEYFGSTFLEAVFVGDEEQEEEREKKASEERTRKTLKDRFVHHCMCYSLLHEFDALSSTLFRIDFDNVRDLDHLAHLIWDLSMKEMVPRVWKQDWGWDT